MKKNMKIKKIVWKARERNRFGYVGKWLVATISPPYKDKRYTRSMHIGLSMDIVKYDTKSFGTHNSLELAEKRSQKVFEEFIKECLE